MTRFQNTILAAVTLLTVLSGPLHAQLQSEIAQQLLSEDRNIRGRGLDSARRIPPQDVGPELRRALLIVLRAENATMDQSTTAGRPVPGSSDPEFRSILARTVANLKHPDAIRELARAFYVGPVIARSLAEFGPAALPAVLQVVTDVNAHYDQVNHGLLAMRYMIEASAGSGLSQSQRGQVINAAKDRLTGNEHFTTLWKAIDLAAALGEPELLEIVRSIAADPDALQQRDITDPVVAAKTKSYAAERLAAVRFPDLESEAATESGGWTSGRVSNSRFVSRTTSS